MRLTLTQLQKREEVYIEPGKKDKTPGWLRQRARRFSDPARD